jgi:signal transduction histidine kinase
MTEIRREEDGSMGEEILVLTKYLVIMDLLGIKGDEGKRIVILNDVTERKKLEESIIRSERLAATGQLAASIAHQINSPLQGITALLSVMKECGADDSDFSGNIRLLEGAFESIRETVRKLLDLNRPGQAEKQLVNIHEIIRDTVSLVGTHLRQADIKARLNFHKESIYLNASPQELAHVFLNLINNAVEAISAEKDRAMGKCGGEITIGTKQDKDLLVIEISDSGPGISEDNLNRIFDAFYTKKGNLGMGIGLAVCKSVIEKHGGAIEAIKKADCGATFRISLPLKK